jgi:SAM-dependent methyltransferase
MPTLEENRTVFDSAYEWVHHGDEWSRSWGGTAMQWHGAILPRIYRFLPAATILDLGAGQGRFAPFLLQHTNNLILMDLSEKCIETCRARFGKDSRVRCLLNDGRSLDMIADDSIDFVFSHDALTFTEAADLEHYLRQLAAKLRKNGVAFLHHSNLGAYWYYRTLSQRWIKLLRRFKFIENDSWRAYSVSAEGLRKVCDEAGLRCITQELLLWWTKKTFLDCYSVIVRQDSPRSRELKVFRNFDFMNQRSYLSRLGKFYDPEAPKYGCQPVTYDTVPEYERARGNGWQEPEGDASRALPA